MIQIIISFAINFIVLIIALTIFRRIVLNNLKKQLREKDMSPIIKIEKYYPKGYSATVKYGCQTFVVAHDSELEGAEFSKQMLIEFFKNYKNGIIDEI